MSSVIAGSQIKPLLRVRELEVDYQGMRRQSFRAVDGVTFEINSGETVALVGESGSGKSTIGRAILGLTSATRGSVTFDGRDITHLRQRARRALSADVQVVFQDPYSSLNPTRIVGSTLAESLRVHNVSSHEVARRVTEMLSRVGLPVDAANRYPREFSGGQRQRIAIARALMVEPRLVVCDEPVSALDVSVQAQVLNLLRELQEQLGLAYLFISHDLAVVQHVADRVLVLYRGRLVEEGTVDALYDNPIHPYTRALLAAAPSMQPGRLPNRERRSTTALPAAENGCCYAPKCGAAVELCLRSRPVPQVIASGQRVACHRWRDLPPPDGSGGTSQRPDVDVEVWKQTHP